MQTFLPYADFAESLACLDYKRLGKQRVEAKQLIKAITGEIIHATTGAEQIIESVARSAGWSNHPAALMWTHYVPALKLYHNMAITEWIHRGYNNSMPFFKLPEEINMPWWFGDDSFHAAHRSNLLRKDSVYYGQFDWEEPNDLPYIWPAPLPPRINR